MLFIQALSLSICLTQAHIDAYGWMGIKEQYKVDTRYFRVGIGSKREGQIKIVQKRRRLQRIVTNQQSF